MLPRRVPSSACVSAGAEVTDDTSCRWCIGQDAPDHQEWRATSAPRRRTRARAGRETQEDERRPSRQHARPGVPLPAPRQNFRSGPGLTEPWKQSRDAPPKRAQTPMTRRDRTSGNGRRTPGMTSSARRATDRKLTSVHARGNAEQIVPSPETVKMRTGPRPSEAARTRLVKVLTGCRRHRLRGLVDGTTLAHRAAIEDGDGVDVGEAMTAADASRPVARNVRAGRAHRRTVEDQRHQTALRSPGVVARRRRLGARRPVRNVQTTEQRPRNGAE